MQVEDRIHSGETRVQTCMHDGKYEMLHTVDLSFCKKLYKHIPTQHLPSLHTHLRKKIVSSD